MEINTDTTVKASSSSGVQMQMQMQLNEQEEQINFIQRKTDKLSITKNPYQEIETHKQFINKAKKEINYFTQLIREFLKGSLNIESIAPFDVEILDIHWNRLIILHLTDINDDVTYINLDMDEETQLEGEFEDLIRKSMRTVRRLILSDEYSSLHDDLKALEKEQYNWLMLDMGINSEPDSDSEDNGMLLD
ncbi:uncharacterized protein LOC144548737 [Carex rostrata]